MIVTGHGDTRLGSELDLGTDHKLGRDGGRRHSGQWRESRGADARLIGIAVVTERQAGDVLNVEVVDERGGHDAHVKDLVRLEQVVTLAREEPFRNPRRVQNRSTNIEQSHEGHVRERDGDVRRREEPVAEGHGDGDAEGDEHRRPHGPEGGRGELLAQRDEDDGCPEEWHENQVDELRARRTVERIIDPGHERARAEQRDATIVEFAADLAHRSRVAAEGVKDGRERETHHGREKVKAKHQLVLDSAKHRTKNRTLDKNVQVRKHEACESANSLFITTALKNDCLSKRTQKATTLSLMTSEPHPK